MLTENENSGKVGGMPKYRVFKIKCLRCEHEWAPRKLDGDIRICPKCKSYLFDKPKKVKPPTPQE